jgi:Stress responsive A/B Barrel Domain
MNRLLILLAALFTLTMTTSTQAADGLYRHVVLFKFKAETTPDQVKSVEEAFKALSKKVDTIVDFEWGTNVSPEGKDNGFTHCFFVSFKDKAGLEVYLPHPAHDEFKKLAGPHFDKVCVIDYVAAK